MTRTKTSWDKWQATLIAFYFVLNLAAASTATPEMTVRGARGGSATLAVESVETDILFFKDIAETTIKITFRNEHNRVLEGEFSMPLPPGATVSGYALDVNGKMRKGVSVEKERARNAYESIKRQMIDPGYVEREKGNVYRTKIFPIPRKGTKAVQLSYRELLKNTDGHLSYTLPVGYPTRIANTRFRITHTENKTVKIINSAGLTFTQKSGTWEATAQNLLLGSQLSLKLPAVEQNFAVDCRGILYLRTKPPAELTAPQPRPRESILLAWDCSESGRSRNHQKEFELLDRFFAHTPNTAIRLSLIHLVAEDGGEFEIKNGDWSTLKTKLESVLYDGVTNLDALRPWGDLTLLFSDGESHFMTEKTPWESPITLIDSTGRAGKEWQHRAAKSGGAYVNLSANSPNEALPLLTTSSSPQLIVDGTTVDPTNIDTEHRLFLKPKNPLDRQASIDFKLNGRTTNTSALPIRNLSDPDIVRMVHGIWAQQELLRLEHSGSGNQKEIIAHCKKHDLVSDFTSLIVLERFEDHIRYEIPPPEPDLRKRYFRELKDKKHTPLSQLLREWQQRKAWHANTYPWNDYVLRQRTKQITIWKNALDKVFQDKDLDQKAVGAVLKWKSDALRLAEKRATLSKQAEYEQWAAEIKALDKPLNQINISLPAKSQPVTVSVRGFVQTPGNISAAHPISLLKAVEKAGGFHGFGTRAQVVLYRNAEKTVYNTLSKQFKDFPLFPGDMIVVRHEDWDIPFYSSLGGDDPFADDSDTPERADFSEMPAIIDDRKQEYFDNDSLFGEADGGGVGQNPTPLKGHTKVHTPTLSPSPQLKDLDAALSKGEDPIKAYATLRSAARYPDGFYLQVASILKKHGHQALARRTLSNIVEGSTPKPGRYRTWAFLCGKLQDWKAAHKALTCASANAPGDKLIALDLAWVARKLDRKSASLHHWKQAATPKTGDENLTEIAAAHLNGTPNGTPHLPSKEMSQILDLDLRIVISDAGNKLRNLGVGEPDGTSAIHWTGDSTAGSHSHRDTGIFEYAIKDAMPGSYKICCKATSSELVRIHIYRNWGRENMTCEEHILSVPERVGYQTLLTYELTFPE